MKFLFYILSLFASLAAYAQNDTVYFNRKWEEIPARDTASFFRLPRVKDGDLYKVVDYYRSGQIAMTGYATTTEVVIREGYHVYYDSLGFIQREGSYHKGMQTGVWKYYYPGTKKLKDEILFRNDIPEGETIHYDSVISAIQWKGILHEGFRDGSWEYYYPGTQTVELRCIYKNGKLNGKRIWYYRNGSVRRDDLYESNKFISGKCFDSSGKKLEYFKEADIQPHSDKVSRKWTKGLEDIVSKYHINGKGRFKYTVRKAGTVDHIICQESINDVFDKEIMKLIREVHPSPTAKYEGVGVDVEMTLWLGIRDQLIDEMQFGLRLLLYQIDSEYAP